MWKERAAEINRRTVNEDVYRMLRDAILNGEIRPGERLLQEEVARHLGVSRMPVREALVRLGAEGLVTLSPHRGATVSAFDPESVNDVYDLRIVLEGRAAQHAAASATPDERAAMAELLTRLEAAQARTDQVELTQLNRSFHLLVARASHSKVISDLVEMLWHRFPRYAFATVPAEVERANRDHRLIFEAICAGDGDAARKWMAAHISAGRDGVIKHIAESERGAPPV